MNFAARELELWLGTEARAQHPKDLPALGVSGVDDRRGDPYLRLKHLSADVELTV